MFGGNKLLLPAKRLLRAVVFGVEVSYDTGCSREVGGPNG